MSNGWVILTYKIKFNWINFRSNEDIKQSYDNFDDWVKYYLSLLPFSGRHGRSNWCYLSYYCEFKEDMILVFLKHFDIIEEIYDFEKNLIFYRKNK